MSCLNEIVAVARPIAGSYETKLKNGYIHLCAVISLVVTWCNIPFLAISESTWAAFTAHRGLPFRIFAKVRKIALSLSRLMDLCSVMIRALTIPAVGL